MKIELLEKGYETHIKAQDLGMKIDELDFVIENWNKVNVELNYDKDLTAPENVGTTEVFFGNIRLGKTQAQKLLLALRADLVKDHQRLIKELEAL